MAENPSATIRATVSDEGAQELATVVLCDKPRRKSEESFNIDAPLPPRPPARKRAFGDGKPPEHTAVYRLYAAGGELLYVGMSNAPLERFIEHRDTKEWWPEVESYSIDWFLSRADAESAEIDAIKDEWPVHNIAHQPRSDGGFCVPSYLVERLVAEMRSAVAGTGAQVTDEQLDHAADLFRISFTYEIFPNSEIWFAESDAPDRRVRQDIDEVIKALGAFRPPIGNSMRDPNPEPLRDGFCDHSTPSGRCMKRLDGYGVCPADDLHTADFAADLKAMGDANRAGDGS